MSEQKMNTETHKFMVGFLYWVGLESIYQMQLARGIGMTRMGVFSVSARVFLAKHDAITNAVKEAS